MSETTPLTAANAARAMTLLVMASRVDPNLRSAVADVESYIAELQREIEGYRQAMELELCPAHSKHFATVGLSEPLSFKASCPLRTLTNIAARCSVARRVLAGKGAQGA